MAGNSISARTRAAFAKEAEVFGLKVTEVLRGRNGIVIYLAATEATQPNPKNIVEAMYGLGNNTRQAPRGFVQKLRKDFAPTA